MVIVDANIIVGFILCENNPADKSYREAILTSQKCMLLEYVAAEVYSRARILDNMSYHASGKSYGLAGAKKTYDLVNQRLCRLVDSGNMTLEDSVRYHGIVSILLETGLDWVDCALLYEARTKGTKVATLDKQLKRRLQEIACYVEAPPTSFDSEFEVEFISGDEESGEDDSPSPLSRGRGPSPMQLK